MLFSPLEQFNIIPLILLVYMEFDLDYSFTNILLPLVIVLIIVISVNFFYNKESLLIPSLFQYIVEGITEFILLVIKEQIGKNGYIFFPLLFTLFNYILLCNYISLLPMGIALTSHIVLTLYVSVSMCFSIFIFGLVENKFNFFKLFVPTCPFILMPMLICIEIFSYLLRSLSLAIRLSANILAGHTLVYIICMSIMSLTFIKLSYFILGLVIILPILILEMAIAFLQAYVYVVLLSIYIKEI